MRNLYSIVAVLCFLVNSTITLAQDKGTLKGVISDKNETLIGANIVLKSDPSIGASTDFEGKYTMQLPAGQQTVVISFTGYNKEEHKVNIKAGQTTRLNVELELESKELGAVVVSAGKFEQKIEDITVSMEIINPSLVENKGTTSAETAIAQTPGVSIIDSEPQIRGGSGYSFGAGSRVMILVDDLPLLSGDAGRPSWGFIPVENLEQIEVIKGASSVLYGSAALNGVINIRTAYPKDTPQTKINVIAGMYDNPPREETKWWDGANPMNGGVSFFHSRKIKNLDLVVGGNFFADDGHVGPAPDSTGAVPESSALTNILNEQGTFTRRARMNFNLRYRSKRYSGLSIGLNGNFMKSLSRSALLWHSLDSIYRPFPGSDTRTNQTTFNIDPYITYFDKRYGNRHSLRTRMFHLNNDNTNNQANKNTLFYGEYQFQRKFQNVRDLMLTAGIMGMHTNSEAQLYAGDEDGDGINTSANAAVYAQIDKKFWKRLNYTLGFRYEYFTINNDESEGKPVFRTGLSLKTLEATYIRASFGQGFRFPTIAERYIQTTVGGLPIFPNPDIESESSWNAEIGIKQGVKLGKFYGYIDVAGFWQEYYNTIEFSFGPWGESGNFLADLGFKSLNTGHSRVQGVDVSILGEGKFTDHFGLNILCGYTYTKPVTLEPNLVYEEDNTTSYQGYSSTSVDTTNNILKYRFQHLVKADVEFLIYDLAVGFSARYNSYMQNVDKIFYDLDVGVIPTELQGVGVVDFRGDSYNEETGRYELGKHEGILIFDARISYNVTNNSKIALIVNNLTNEEYALRPLKIDAMRNYAIQYTLKF